MITTVIRLPEEEYTLYKELAREQNISVAEYFRQAARKKAKRPVKEKNYSIWDLGIKIKTKGGPVDGALHHDRYYYEAEEAKIRRQHGLPELKP